MEVTLRCAADIRTSATDIGSRCGSGSVLRSGDGSVRGGFAGGGRSALALVRPNRRAARPPPTVDTAMVIRAPRISAGASPGSEQVLLGGQGGSGHRYPELRAGQRAETEWLAGEPHGQMGQQRRLRPDTSPSRITAGWPAEAVHIQRSAQPDEEQWAEESIGEREQLFGDPARFADRRHRQSAGESRPA